MNLVNIVLPCERCGTPAWRMVFSGKKLCRRCWDLLWWINRILDERDREKMLKVPVGEFLWLALAGNQRAEQTIKGWSLPKLEDEVSSCLHFLAQQEGIMVTCAEEDFADVAEDYRLANNLLYSLRVEVAMRRRDLDAETRGRT